MKSNLFRHPFAIKISLQAHYFSLPHSSCPLTLLACLQIVGPLPSYLHK